MKTTAAKCSIKRKQNTSLLRVANIKKKRIHLKGIKSSEFVHREGVKTQAGFPESFFCPVDQLTKTKIANEKLINHQNKHALQQKEVKILIQNQGFTSYCDCLFCSNNHQWQNQVQTFKQRRISQQQQRRNSKASQINFDVKQANQSPAQNFKLFLKTQRVKTRVVSDRNFYKQNVDFNPKYNSNQQGDIYTAQPNWSAVNENQSNELNLNNIDFHNQYVSCYDQNIFCEVFDQISTLQQGSGSITTSIESFGSDTNNVMTSQHFDQSFMTSRQFQMNNNVNYCNYVY